MTDAEMVKAATAHILKPAAILRLADECLLIEPHHPAVTRWLLAAIAMVESGGDPGAIGDNGRAVGLFQFHRAAWDDAWLWAVRPKAPSSAPSRGMKRTDARHSMRAAILYLSWGARRIERTQTAQYDMTTPFHASGRTASLLASFHNSGRPGVLVGPYWVKVRRMMKMLHERHGGEEAHDAD